MNLLLITFSFPPAGGVGVLRALSLAKYLPENGVRVDVLTARNAPAVGEDLSLLAQVPAAVTVHRTWTLDLPFALRKRIKKFITGGIRKSPTAQPQASKKTGKGNPLKSLIGNLLLPDPQVGWLPFAFSAARRIIRRRNIDVVLITVPPFSTVLLVSKLRKVFPALPIFLDFRDEWLTTTINLVSFNNNDRARSVASRAEAESVRDATTVVAVTEAARLELMGRYPDERPDKFHWIPNGFDTALGEVRQPLTELGASPKARAAGLQGKVVLTYIGTVYGSTDPTTFVEAILGLPVEARSQLRLRFVGHVETPAYRELLLGLGETIELKGFVPQAEALQAMEDTDYLLLITRDRINVAAKFYDYLGGSKPIVAAVHPAGDVRKLLEETRAGRWADVYDVDAIRNMLLSLLYKADSRASDGGSDMTRIASFHRRSLSKRYAMLLHEVRTQHKAVRNGSEA